MSDYPEHEKQSDVAVDAEVIGEFLEWLPTQGYYICVTVSERETFSGPVDEYFPTHAGIEDLLADYFGIDRGKLESEKRQMLDVLRSQNA